MVKNCLPKYLIQYSYPTLKLLQIYFIQALDLKIEFMQLIKGAPI